MTGGEEILYLVVAYYGTVKHPVAWRMTADEAIAALKAIEPTVSGFVERMDIEMVVNGPVAAWPVDGRWKPTPIYVDVRQDGGDRVLMPGDSIAISVSGPSTLHLRRSDGSHRLTAEVRYEGATSAASTPSRQPEPEGSDLRRLAEIAKAIRGGT
jgi:hypothetical protein